MKETSKTAGQTANNLTFICDYVPAENTYMLTSCGVCKVDHILVFSDPCGKLIIKNVFEMASGIRMEEDDYIEPLFKTRIAENIVMADDVDYYRGFFNDVDSESMAIEILDELLAWGIDTVQKNNGSKVTLQEYVNETILRR